MSTTRQIVCGSCGRINRLPVERAAQDARCGACHQPIFTGHPIEVDEEAFGRHVGNSDIPVLVDVWAPWCGPCRAMAPMFERAAQQLEPKVRLLKLNSDNAPALSSRLLGAPAARRQWSTHGVDPSMMAVDKSRPRMPEPVSIDVLNWTRKRELVCFQPS